MFAMMHIPAVDRSYSGIVRIPVAKQSIAWLISVRSIPM